MTEYKNLMVSCQNHIATVTLNRPDMANACDSQLFHENQNRF